MKTTALLSKLIFARNSDYHIITFRDKSGSVVNTETGNDLFHFETKKEMKRKLKKYANEPRTI